MAIGKTNAISVSGGGGESTIGKYKVLVVDYDGEIIDEQWASENDVYTMPTPPTHTGLVFDGWSSTEQLTNNQITIKRDFMAGALYYTASGKVEYDVEITARTGKTITINENNLKDWGDGTSDSLTTHTYTNYGKYTVITDTLATFNFTDTIYYVINIRLPNTQVTFASQQLNKIGSLETISIPNASWKIIGVDLEYANNLKCIVYPTMQGSVSQSRLLNYAHSLKYVIFPYNVSFTSSFTRANSCERLKMFVFPHEGSSTNGSFFGNEMWSLERATSHVNLGGTQQYSLKYADVRGATSIISFQSCANLQERRLPESYTSFGGFTYAPIEVTGEEIEVPNGVTLIKGPIGWSITKIVIPATLASTNEFCKSCRYLKVADFRNCTSIPTLTDSNIFNASPLAVAVVPDSLYSSWIAASNWANNASKIISASDYAALTNS